MFLFDKRGEWHDEGVYHDALSMEKTYNETNWYDSSILTISCELFRSKEKKAWVVDLHI